MQALLSSIAVLRRRDAARVRAVRGEARCDTLMQQPCAGGCGTLALLYRDEDERESNCEILICDNMFSCCAGVCVSITLLYNDKDKRRSNFKNLLCSNMCSFISTTQRCHSLLLRKGCCRSLLRRRDATHALSAWPARNAFS